MGFQQLGSGPWGLGPLRGYVGDIWGYIYTYMYRILCMYIYIYVFGVSRELGLPCFGSPDDKDDSRSSPLLGNPFKGTAHAATP